jgi:WD40 repeat protein
MIRYYDFESQGQAHSTAISSVAFSKDSRFLLSTSSNTYHFLANIRPEGWFSKITKMWVAAMMIFYLLHLVIKAFTE